MKLGYSSQSAGPLETCCGETKLIEASSVDGYSQLVLAWRCHHEVRPHNSQFKVRAATGRFNQITADRAELSAVMDFQNLSGFKSLGQVLTHRSNSLRIYLAMTAAEDVITQGCAHAFSAR